MELFLFYAKLGINHVLDVNGLDHFYFIFVLLLPFRFKDIRKCLWWITLFTLGHSISLILNQFLLFSAADLKWIELAIALTIAVSCLPLLLNSTKLSGDELIHKSITFSFGCIHGFGFSRYYSIIKSEENSFWELFSFSIGIEIAQIIILLVTLTSSFVVVRLLRYSKSKWEFFAGTMVFSQSIGMILGYFF